MVEPDRQDGLAFVFVEERRVTQAVERLKGTLPDEPHECPACGYAGETFRWGINTYPTKEPRRSAIVLCCPGCGRPTDLPPVDVGPGDGV